MLLSDEDIEVNHADVCWLRRPQLGVYVMSIRHRRTREHLRSKVGISANPQARCKTVSSDQFPHIAVLVYFVPTPDAERVEASAHELLETVALGREYFGCDTDAAINAVREAMRCG